MSSQYSGSEMFNSDQEESFCELASVFYVTMNASGLKKTSKTKFFKNSLTKISVQTYSMPGSKSLPCLRHIVFCITVTGAA